MPAIAILIPLRAPLSTETPSSRGTGGGAPPPGFDIEMAKRPMKEARDAEKEALKARAPADGQAVAPKAAAKTEEDARTLTELAAQKGKDEDKAVAKKKDEKKPTVWQRVKKEVVHYWDGTKLLATEVKISWRLALKMAAGYELTRRENRQVRRAILR
jgi:LETM1 and EF-hand domain-containing protein 1